jgi:hypothetical protein
MPITCADAGGRRAFSSAVQRVWLRTPAVLTLVAAGVLWQVPASGGERPTSVASAGNTEWVSFGDSGLPPVRVIHGTAPPIRRETVQIVKFGAGQAGTVKIVRGLGTAAPAAALIARSEARPAAARLLRILGTEAGALFTPDAGRLDRIAFAVDGIESRHGNDPRMWRAEPLGPQGPMQVSAAAAADVGGGNRFDLRENRLLGRAYLAQMYQRYGNWSDALAAYNWGPGNLDQWIVAGRPAQSLPDGVARYVGLVLSDALVSLSRW